MGNNPILILHSWNQYAKDVSRYSPLKDELVRRGYKVFTPELPGFYSAGLPKKALVRDDYVEFVEKYLRDKGIKKIILIGHSFGGTVGMKLAVKNPQLLKALVLTGAPGFVPIPSPILALYKRIAKAGNIVFSLPILTPFRTIVRKLLYKSIGATDYPKAQGVMRETFINAARENLVPTMEQIKIPTLIIWGKKDRIAPLWIAKKMIKVISNSKLIILNGRHGVPFTHAKEFVDQMEKFLEPL